MKKVYVFVIVAMMLALIGCSNTIDSSYNLSKEGIEPYKLSENEQYILQSFGMEDTSQIISFNAPKDAISLNINIYRLKDDKTWDSIGGGAISTSVDMKNTEQLTGIFTMQMRDNYSIGFNINSNGLYSFYTDDIMLDKAIVGSQKIFLQDFENITLNTEIPVALMVYSSGTSMKSYSLQDYFEPLKFSGMDLVQVVTMTFSDKEM